VDIGWQDAMVADGHVRAALVETAQIVERDTRGLVDMREEDVRRALFDALASRLPGRVRKEHALTLAAFRGVGGFDILVDRWPQGAVAWLGEVKWSYTTRTKIFEAVWDAVKLCLGAAEHGAARCWLVTGAPNAQWRAAECRELFGAGTVSFESLWNQVLDPTGPNGGKTVGEDLLAGGRGNRFTRAPEAFTIDEVGRQDLRPGGENWSLRAVAVSAAGDWIENLAPPPVFPQRIGQPWLNAKVPGMSDAEFAALIAWLRQKRWNDDELAKRMYPLRRDE
jgi:hypothetical protein